MPSNLDAALAYAHRAWRIFPLPYPRPDGTCSCGKPHDDPNDIGKHPTLPDWQVKATYDEQQVRAWWQAKPLANIALVTGLATGVFILDVDGSAGELSLAKLQALYGQLPITYEVETGRGRHLYFLHPDEPGRIIPNSTGRLSPSLDIRGEGGYVVAPPSLHGSAKRYTITPDRPSLPAPAPGWLIDLLIGRADHRRDARLAPKLIPQGQRDTALTRLAGQLRWHGLEEAEIHAALVIRNKDACRPPLGEKDLQRIAASIGRKDPSKFSAMGAVDDDELVMIALDQVKLAPVTWRWHKFLPFGSLVAWSGDPGQGKSTLAYHLAALISRGAAMPFVNGDVEKFAPANVIILSGEDSAAQVVGPRLTVAGADLTKIKQLRATTQNGRTVSLPDHLPQLRQFASELKPQLIIVDPLNAFVSIEVDSHKDAELRHGILQPLASIAEEFGSVVLGISHLNKSQAAAMYRVGGSIAMVGAPRAVFVFADNEDQPGEHLFACLKANLSARPSSLIYSIEETVLAGIGPVSRIKFIKESGLTAVDALNQGTPEERGAGAEARAFLQLQLAAGMVGVKELEQAARGQEISPRTLKRARQQLKVEAKRLEGRWFLALPGYRWATQEDQLPFGQRSPGSNKQLEEREL